VVIHEKEKPARKGFFSTELVEMPQTVQSQRMALDQILGKTFQRGLETLQMVDQFGEATGESFAMDELPDMNSAKVIGSCGGWIPFAQLEYFAQQGFPGFQTLAMLYQHWLIAKACNMPPKDCMRNGWELKLGDDVDAKVIKKIKKRDREMQLKKRGIEYLTMGRVFGIRHCLYVVEGVDYSLPFNIDGVRPGSYKGMVQIDPYWVAPMLDGQAASNPASGEFYNPTWWMIRGKRVHRSHMSIMINDGELPDILKPTYQYAGVSVPQKIFERVYAAEKTANEGPQLAMSKRMTVLGMDVGKALVDVKKFVGKMGEWLGYQNSFGIKVIDKESEEVSQYDTSLQGVDETTMTQYQLVAAACDVPATKLMGTSPKGFGASGEYEETSYHEYLESLQENQAYQFLDGHYKRLLKSEFPQAAPDGDFEIVFEPVDSPDAKEEAEINKTKAETDQILTNVGSIDGKDGRDRLIADKKSGYSGIDPIVPDGPGDREAEQEAAAAEQAALEAPVSAKASAKPSGGTAE